MITLGSIAILESLVKDDTYESSFDFRRNGKKATVKRHQMAASPGVERTSCDLN